MRSAITEVIRIQADFLRWHRDTVDFASSAARAIQVQVEARRALVDQVDVIRRYQESVREQVAHLAETRQALIENLQAVRDSLEWHRRISSEVQAVVDAKAATVRLQDVVRSFAFQWPQYEDAVRASSTIAAMQSQILAASQQWGMLPELTPQVSRYVATEVATALDRSLTDKGLDAATALTETFQKIAADMLQRAADDSRRQGQIQLLVALFLFLLQLLLNLESDDAGVVAELPLGVADTLASSVAAVVVAGAPDWIPGHYVSRGLHLRSGPGTSYPSLRTLPRGTLVEVGGADGGWVEVGVLDWATGAMERGWAYGRCVRTIALP